MNERLQEQEGKKKARELASTPIVEKPKVVPILAQGLYAPAPREVFTALGRNEHRDGEQTKPHKGEGHSSRIEHVHLVSDNQSRGGDRHVSDRNITKNLVSAVEGLG